MKKFDLFAALKGDPVVTRDGKDVTRIIHIPEIEYDSKKVLAIIDGEEEFFDENGRYDEDIEYCSDLFMKSEKQKLYIGIANNASLAFQDIPPIPFYQCSDAYQNRDNVPKHFDQIVEIEIDA